MCEQQPPLQGIPQVRVTLVVSEEAVHTAQVDVDGRQRVRQAGVTVVEEGLSGELR